MNFVPPIDLNAAWQDHVNDVVAGDRDPHRLAASDLHGCARAFFDRYHGAPLLEPSNSTFSAFERGHAYAPRFFAAASAYAKKAGLVLAKSKPVLYEGIEAHPDFLLFQGDTLLATIDPTTTASKSADFGYGHALKGAFYSVALGCDLFCEWQFCIGFGGNILQHKPWWFHLDEIAVRPDGTPMDDGLTGATWRTRVKGSLEALQALAASEQRPGPLPPWNPIGDEKKGMYTAGPETWRCRAYCRNAACERNELLAVPMTAQHA